MQNMTLANIAACLKSPLCQGDGKEAFEITTDKKASAIGGETVTIKHNNENK